MKTKIDIITDNETFEPTYEITLFMPGYAFDPTVLSNKEVRAEMVKLIGAQVLDDVEAFIAKRQNELLHTVTK